MAFSDEPTDERALAALSRVVSQFVIRGKIGAKVIDRQGVTRVFRLSPEVEDELQDAKILLASKGRHFE